MGATSSIIPDRIDENSCKSIVGEANFNQENFNEMKNEDGFITHTQLKETMLAAIWDRKLLGCRNADVQPTWDFMKENWKQIPGMSISVIEQFRGVCPMLDQNPVEVLEEVKMEEVSVNGNIALICIPTVLENSNTRSAVVYFHGGGFIMSSPVDWKKECAKQALLSNSIVFCPTIGVGPETKAPAWMENAYTSLKWLLAEAEQYKVDTTKVSLHGSSHGAYTALSLCKLLAEKDETSLVKFCWLDIPAIDNDFVEHYKCPENEGEEMHQACSRLHMQCWATLFTDEDKLDSFDWNDYTTNAEAFPAMMDDTTLSKIPPCLLTTAEFDHVGVRGSRKFAGRLEPIGKLLGIYVQPGCGHALYGAAQEERNNVFKFLYSYYL